MCPMNRMNLRNTLLALCGGGILLSASATEPIAERFIALPDSLIPTLETNRRMDLIDLFHAKQTANATNRLGGTSTLTLLQDSLLSLDLSAQSRLEMRLLPYQKGETILALIHTVCAPACDSRIDFYTTHWEERPVSKHIRHIDLDEFLQFPDTLPLAQQKELRQLVGIRLLEYTFTPEGNLQVSPSWQKYLDEESFKLIQPYLRDHIILRWNGKKFT